MKKTIIISSIFLVIFIGWISSYAVEKKYKWYDIKKSVKPIIPDIPKEYEPLIKVFNEYWEALKKGDYKKAYTYESEKFKKEEAPSLEKYIKRFNKRIILTGVRALSVKKINEREVIVKAAISFKSAEIDTVRFYADRWVKEAEGWRHYPIADKPMMKKTWKSKKVSKKTES